MEGILASGPVLGRTLLVAAAMFVGAVVVLRVAGKRTLSKWNAFDSVVTIAMGSALATAILSRQTSLAQGLLAFAALVALQFVLSWLAVRSGLVDRLIKSAPTLLVTRGTIHHPALRRQRITEGELRAAVRASGIANLDDLEAVVLETDGAISVVPRVSQPGADRWAIRELEAPTREARPATTETSAATASRSSAP